MFEYIGYCIGALLAGIIKVGHAPGGVETEHCTSPWAWLTTQCLSASDVHWADSTIDHQVA